MTKTNSSKLATLKLLTQFGRSPEERLMCAIVCKAIDDAVAFGSKEAIKYLQDDLIHAEAAGIDPDWVKKVINAIQPDLLTEAK